MSAVGPCDRASFPTSAPRCCDPGALDSRRRALTHFGMVAGGTLASRVLGMLRDMVTASLFGLSSGVLDSLVLAFRIPNLFRALFGEGALATCYVPYLSRKRSNGDCWQSVSAVCFWLAVFLSMLLVAGELTCGLLWCASADPATRLTLGLSAVLLPYFLFVCLAAQVAATLQTFSRFAASAAAPSLLNITWLAAAWWVAPSLSDEPAVQAYLLAAAIVVAGVAQLAVQLPSLAALGFQFRLTRQASRDVMHDLLPALGPTLLVLSVTRINTFCDSLFAWTLSGPSTEFVPWLGGLARYPLEPGAASSMYCAERLCHFPVGLLGVSIATVVFPRLSRQAASGAPIAFARELLDGLRLVLLLAVPASAGLWLLAEPLTELLFKRGQFSAQDMERTASMVRCYSVGVWACCAMPVLLRVFYARGDRVTPLRIGMASVVMNLTINATLVWPLGESALALSTSICATAQCVSLAWVTWAQVNRSVGKDLLRMLSRYMAGAAAMFLAGGWVLQALQTHFNSLVSVMGTIGACTLLYAILLGPFESTWLRNRLYAYK